MNTTQILELTRVMDVMVFSHDSSIFSDGLYMWISFITVSSLSQQTDQLCSLVLIFMGSRLFGLPVCCCHCWTGSPSVWRLTSRKRWASPPRSLRHVRALPQWSHGEHLTSEYEWKGFTLRNSEARVLLLGALAAVSRAVAAGSLTFSVHYSNQLLRLAPDLLRCRGWGFLRVCTVFSVFVGCTVCVCLILFAPGMYVLSAQYLDLD